MQEKIIKSRKLDDMSQTTLKKKLFNSSKVCNICNISLDFDEHNIKFSTRLDHKIPISMGGSKDCFSNLQLLCRKCDVEKTNIDILIINLAKKLNYIESYTHNYYLFISKQDLINFYSDIQKIILSTNIKKV